VAKEVQARWIGRFPLTFLIHLPHGKLNPGHILHYESARGFKDYADVEHSMITMGEIVAAVLGVPENLGLTQTAALAL
jgi:hypothetical protein